MVLDGIGIGYVPEREYLFAVDAFDVRPQWFGAGRQHQFVVCFGVSFTGIETFDLDESLFGVNCRDLLFDTDVDTESVGETLDRLHEEFRTLGYCTSDIVWQAAVGVRDVFSAFEQNNVGLFIHSAQAGGDGCSSGDTSDNQVFHLGNNGGG